MTVVPQHMDDNMGRWLTNNSMETLEGYKSTNYPHRRVKICTEYKMNVNLTFYIKFRSK